jgi:phosphinothricin acetyltransferase
LNALSGLQLVRPATLADAPAIQRIYAHHVLHGTATYEEVPPDLAEMETRIAKILDRGWPYLLAEADGEVVGFAYCAQFRERPSYRYSGEDSVYVRDDMRGRKVGRMLLAALLPRAEACGFRQLFAVIGDAENAGSIGLHASMGFVEVGRLRHCGVKFGRWLDVVIMQRALGQPEADPPPT